MTKKQELKIFEKYNPQTDVVRCPNGRAHIRKILNLYAKAAVNLYGVISKEEFVEIFNSQSGEQTNVDEIYILLLPLILKDKWYSFYKDYIVHFWCLEDFKYADYLINQQGDKPRYIPHKEEFLEFESQYYESEPQCEAWNEVFEHMQETWPDNLKVYRCYNELKEYITHSFGIKEVGPIMDKHGIRFTDENNLQEFFNLLMNAKNNTRIWENKGCSPEEIGKLMAETQKNEKILPFPIQQKTKVGRNDSCPCGSGKKYKKCCAIIDEAKTAQLGYDEVKLFYGIWYGLMEFVNQKYNVIRLDAKLVYPEPVNEMKIHKIREVLWEQPDLINEYLSAAQLPQEHVDILKSWRKSYKKDHFIIMQYLPEYAVLLGSNSEKEDRLYGVKGISNSIANVMHRELPIAIETVLLPFKDKIIYDSLIGTFSIGFGEGARDSFWNNYNNAFGYGIITRFNR